MKLSLRRNLRLKILLSTLLGSLFFSVVLFVSLTLLAHDIVLDAALRTEQEIFSSRLLFLRHWFAERRREILMLSKVETILSMDLSRIQLYMKENLPSREGFILHYIVADTEGRFATSLVPDAGNLSHREYFQDVMRGEAVVSEAVISMTTGKPIVVVAAPVFNPSNEVIGLFGLALDLTALHAYFSQQIKPRPDTHLLMVDSLGRLLLHYQGTAIKRASILQPSRIIPHQVAELGQTILSEPHLNVYSDGIHLLSGQIEGTPGFRFVVFCHGTMLDDLVGDLQTRLLVFSIALLLATSLAIILTSRIWTKHLFILKEIFDRAATGDFSVIAPENGDRDLGLVSHSFNLMMRTIRGMTYFDPITGLPNRTYFEDFVRKSLGAERTVGFSALIILSVDKFKNINDIHGGTVGDDLLKQIGKRLIRTLTLGAMISRGNGAEFNIFIAHSDSRALVVTGVDAVFKDSALPFVINEEKFYLTYSAGIAFFPTDATHFDELMIHASIAKNTAKKVGGNKHKVFNESMKLGLSRQMQVEAQLHVALEFGQFHLVYQPQVDTFTSEIIGMEALLRWNSPELGVVSPAVFIPIAEDSGLIRPIGQWVLESACRQNKAWMDAGYRCLPVAVNVSTLQFDQPKFLEEVAQVLHSTGLPPHLLELEITERIAMGPIEETLKKLRAIDAMGIKINVDDFGTGYSSLNYFKEFPIHALKIDQSFIRDIPNDSISMAIVETVIAMGVDFQLDIIAEGVETLKQLTFVQGKGCKKVQGYYFSKPLCREDMGECLRTGILPQKHGTKT